MHKHDDHISEEKLTHLLSSLKTEPLFPDNFEEKFLQEMHRRRTQEPVREPVSTSVGAFLSNIFRAKWVYGAATAVTAIAILAIIVFDSKPASNASDISVSGDVNMLQPVSLVKEQTIAIPDEEKDEQDQSKQKKDETEKTAPKQGTEISK